MSVDSLPSGGTGGNWGEFGAGAENRFITDWVDFWHGLAGRGGSGGTGRFSDVGMSKEFLALRGPRTLYYFFTV
jgi:hypothetical protein